jgi:hypothetical protein
VITIKDAVFKNGGTKGSDFELLNADDKDDVFSLVEVHRGEQEFPLLRPQEDNRAFKGSAKGTKYNKGENAVEGDKEKKGKRVDKEDKSEKREKRKKDKSNN